MQSGFEVTGESSRSTVIAVGWVITT